MTKVQGFHFDNSYLQLPSCFYHQQEPVVVVEPELVIFNDELASSLGLDFSSIIKEEQAGILAGNVLLNDTEYFSQAYAGHQFGHFTMLGDGRAVMLGEHITPDGKRFDLQFKGSGRTPFSRSGDGRAVLGPMLREYIISEAMYHLGIATTRSLSVIKTGEQVRRETMLPGAILLRVANSHLRVGTFEFAAAQQDLSVLRSLLDYAIARHYPELADADNQALAFLKAVMMRQIDLIVDWMRVGFIHGVMNTDNMTISGETIDYGPCAFMDIYNPATVFSSIDHAGRYAYQNQPIIAQWNLARLAETLLPLIHQDRALQLSREAIESFTACYQDKWLNMMRAKLGLFSKQPEDEKLINDLLAWMQKNNADFTNTFIDLGQSPLSSDKQYQTEAFVNWYQRWQTRRQQDKKPLTESLRLMAKVNPLVIPRNHQVERALVAAYQDDFVPLQQLLAVLKNPYQSGGDVGEYQRSPAPSERVHQTFCGT